VVDEGSEFGEGEVGVALGVVLHSKAVAGEGVGGVGGENFGEGGNLVHELMVRCDGRRWQVRKVQILICSDDAESRTGSSKTGPSLREE
jgi:hypothetical protein